MVKISKKIEQELIKEAIKAREKAFSPFSGSKVGISVLTKDGIFSGHNVEFARSMNIHGEPFVLSQVLANYMGPKLRNLKPKEIDKKIREGFKEIIAIVEVNSEGIPGCGPCRQYVLEVNPNMIFYGVKPNGKIVAKKKISELYPIYYRSNDKFRL
jgi:cytidine deaminase